MKERYFIFVILIFIASCSTSKSSLEMSDYDNMQPIKELIKSDASFKEFIYNFKIDVETHKWTNVTTYFDNENFQIQRNLGIDTAQYIAEGMGLNYIDNKLESKLDDNSKYSGLNNIIRLDFRAYKTEGNVIYVYGYLKLYSGTIKRFELRCIKDKNKMLIAPAVG